MSMPFYVAPEQQMKDRADFARKGIARGRSVVVLRYADGILFVAENPSQALHKVSEIYDRIGFAAVGRYNEFEALRMAGIRHADLRGYSYARSDVTGRGLANSYAQLLGTIFSTAGEKPYEVEIVVAELGATVEGDQIYRLTYDGSVRDEEHFAVMAGSAEVIDDAWRWKQRMGGAMRQSGMCAAACLYALDHNVERLAEDHENARVLARELAQMPGITVERHDTNLVFFDVGGTGLSGAELASKVRERGILVSVMGPNRVRACTHLDVDRAGVLDAAAAIREVVAAN